MLRTVYGRHAAVRRQEDATILAQFQRHPGLKSNFSGLDSLLGKVTEFDTCDMFRSPFDNEENVIEPHVELEKNFGM